MGSIEVNLANSCAVVVPMQNSVCEVFTVLSLKYDLTADGLINTIPLNLDESIFLGVKVFLYTSMDVICMLVGSSTKSVSSATFRFPQK